LLSFLNRYKNIEIWLLPLLLRIIGGMLYIRTQVENMVWRVVSEEKQDKQDATDCAGIILFFFKRVGYGNANRFVNCYVIT
jgi:hypothetical protein